jgi:hypothetical protein
MCGQGWLLVGAGAVEPVEADADDPGDELVDVVCAIVDPVAAAPPVAASATPVAPAPRPAATTPVMSNRRARPPILAIIWFLPSRRPRSARRSGIPGCEAGLAVTASSALSGL